MSTNVGQTWASNWSDNRFSQKSYNLPFDQQILMVRVISQGSILGPILYANYVSAIFDIADLLNFADGNYVHDFDK